MVSEEEYFTLLEEVGEKLGMLLQLSSEVLLSRQLQGDSCEKLAEDEVFKKKDSSLNKVINYNLMKGMELVVQMNAMKELISQYEGTLVFSLARCYYLILNCRNDIDQHRADAPYLLLVEEFLTDKQELIFPQLYNRKITKALVMLEEIRCKTLQVRFQRQEFSD
jgi:hypothetical protein